jgi:aminopeptidase N
MYCDYLSKKDNLNQITLDFTEQLKVSKIEGATSFKQSNKQLKITLLKNISKDEISNIKVYYEGVPPTEDGENGIKKGLIYAKHGKNNNPVIASVCYPDGASLWFPCKKGISDKSDSIYVDITIANKKVDQVFINKKTKEEETKQMPIIAVSNGKLEGIKKIEGDKKKYQWRHRHPIAPHHVLLAVSNFMKAESSFKGKGYEFPMNFYILPENLRKSSSMMRRIPEIMACLTNTFGPYPYRDEGFNVTQTGMDLGLDGMPTQTNVLLEDMKATHMYKVVHEMASMWFGNHISPKNWQDAWITEALAAYAEGMWQEYKRGLTVYQIILDEKEYFDGGKLYLDKPEDYSKERLNKKGMYAIHMLRGIMTDAYFFETLKAIVAGKRLKNPADKNFLSTKRFQNICEYYASENIDRDYTYFFEQWIKGEFYPEFKVSYAFNAGKLNLTVKQDKRNTTPSYFSMPVKIDIVMEDGSKRKETLKYTEAEQSFEFDMDATVTDVLFDPDNWIFKDLKYVRKVMNEKFALEDFEIIPSEDRRKLEIKYDVPKKQDVTIEIVRLADGMSVKEDKIISSEIFKKESGSQLHEYELKLAQDSRGEYKIMATTKGEKFIKRLRVKRTKEIF